MATIINKIQAVDENGETVVANAAVTNLYLNDKGNLCLETSDELGQTGTKTTKGKINIESRDDLQIKAGDDINVYSHHRPAGKQDEVSVKYLEEVGDNEYPVKLQVNCADINITTKGKDNTATRPDLTTETPSDTAADSNVLNITINKDKGTRGYLKVRAQAIDLRCEDHGGVALQPKGSDSDGNQNKIKFEHGGGDGLEFGTFNTKYTSLFTDQYRFNRDGVLYYTLRTKEESDKRDSTDPTTYYKYQKQLSSQNGDDSYDKIDRNQTAEENKVTWGDVIDYVLWAKKNKQGPFQDGDTTSVINRSDFSQYTTGSVDLATKDMLFGSEN